MQASSWLWEDELSVSTWKSCTKGNWAIVLWWQICANSLTERILCRHCGWLHGGPFMILLTMSRSSKDLCVMGRQWSFLVLSTRIWALMSLVASLKKTHQGPSGYTKSTGKSLERCRSKFGSFRCRMEADQAIFFGGIVPASVSGVEAVIQRRSCIPTKCLPCKMGCNAFGLLFTLELWHEQAFDSIWERFNPP